jgi:hypothetical protein
MRWTSPASLHNPRVPARRKAERRETRFTPAALTDLDALVRGTGYRLGEPPPEKFVIYVMIDWLRRGAKAGQAKSARNRWINDQTTWQVGLRLVRQVARTDQLTDRQIVQGCRIFKTSPFVYHAHLDDAEVFEFFPVLDLGDEATYLARAGHFERRMTDTIKADTRWLDYNHEEAAKFVPRFGRRGCAHQHRSAVEPLRRSSSDPGRSS